MYNMAPPVKQIGIVSRNHNLRNLHEVKPKKSGNAADDIMRFPDSSSDEDNPMEVKQESPKPDSKSEDKSEKERPLPSVAKKASRVTRNFKPPSTQPSDAQPRATLMEDNAGAMGDWTQTSQRRARERRPIRTYPLSQGTTANIHRPISLQDHHRRKISPSSSGSEGIEGRNGFNAPPIDGKRPASPTDSSSQSKRPAFNKPAGSDEVCQKPAFKQPLGPVSKQSSPKQYSTNQGFPRPPSPRKPRAKFNTYGASTRSTGSSQASQSPLTHADGGLTTSQAQDNICTAANLLGIEDAQNLASLVSTNGENKDSPIFVEVLDPDHLDEEETQQKMPGSALNSSHTAKSEPSSSPGQILQSSLSTPPDSPDKARCPLCKALVKKSWLKEVAGTKRLTIRQQAEICKAHKIRLGHDVWKARGYPEIDWEGLSDRLSSYHSRIEELLQSNTGSFYRNALEDTVRSGKSRTLKQAMLQGDTIEGMIPGYYGSRGAKLMAENILARFTSRLRRLGRSDKLISTSGVSGYVQAVLAPELAVMLVMDDMKTDGDGAREILRESVDIGNLLNEEEDEVIHHNPHVEVIQP